MDHQTALVIGGVVLALGLALILGGRSGNRSVSAHDISGTVILGDVALNAPRAEKPAHGWMEWTGWAMGVAGLALALWSLLMGT